MNDKTDPAPQAPAPEDAGPGYDIYSWAVSLGVTVAELRQAIAEVGDSAAAVRRWLARR